MGIISSKRGLFGSSFRGRSRFCWCSCNDLSVKGFVPSPKNEIWQKSKNPTVNATQPYGRTCGRSCAMTWSCDQQGQAVRKTQPCDGWSVAMVARVVPNNCGPTVGSAVSMVPVAEAALVSCMHIPIVFFVLGTIYYGPQLHFGKKKRKKEKKEGEEEKKEGEEEKKEEKKKKENESAGEGKKKEKEKEKKREGRKEKERKRRKKGIAMASLIKKDLPHICDTVNNMDSYCLLRGRVNGFGYRPDARLMPYLDLARSGSAALARTFDLRYDLISALVERWRPETHTFHLPCGECTVTLEDVVLHFGLPIDGDAVTGVSAIAEQAALCYSLLGALPGDAESNFSELKFTWLKANFEHLSYNATEEELMCAAQAWGSAILAMLYHELCQTTKPDAVDMGGCLVLLQSWALYRMSFLASVSHQPYVFLLVNRWSIYPSIGRSYTILIYRLMIEQHAGEWFIWMPYRKPEIVAIIPSSAYVDSQLWCTNTPIISFNIVEWYHGDRVLRQFGCIQYIPDSPMEVGEVHGINKRGKHRQHWGVLYRRFVAVWENQMARRPQMDLSSDLRPSLEYIQWYYSMGKPYLLGGQSIIVPPHVQRSGAYKSVANIEPDPQPDPELDPEPEAESERSYSHSADTSYHSNLLSNDCFLGSSSHSHWADTSYHPNLPGNDYFPGSSGGRYHYGFDIFGSYPPQHNTSPGPYPPHYSTTPGPYPLQYSTPIGLYPP
ncbi:hypothetical protein CXB51_005601 [Gossypium anomalum]|uniref:Aminotransferase-like plant mobile domain-containing protein n=1 Tax=Gossypium anomalum TaxID=47600 RepID=A0A8J5ZCA7_9ROSI|nr:hypothetical protein CXB51_005601 [Gossypium anomalum]